MSVVEGRNDGRLLHGRIA